MKTVVEAYTQSKLSRAEICTTFRITSAQLDKIVKTLGLKRSQPFRIERKPIHRWITRENFEQESCQDNPVAR